MHYEQFHKGLILFTILIYALVLEHGGALMAIQRGIHKHTRGQENTLKELNICELK